jgi:hypothetical protein
MFDYVETIFEAPADDEITRAGWHPCARMCGFDASHRRLAEGVTRLSRRQPHEVAELRMERSMTDIETTIVSAKCKRTGAQFNLIAIPFDFGADECRYINSTHNINVHFEARFIRDEVLVDNTRRVLWSGIILIDGQLQQRLDEATGQRLSKAEIEALKCDCYDLIVEFLRANYARVTTAELQPHIYTAASGALRAFSSSAEVDPNAVTVSRAVQIR